MAHSSSKMSDFTIGSFGEQTLDVLLAAECGAQEKKNDSSNFRTSKLNPRFKKSSLPPLQEICENLVANYSKKNSAPLRQSRQKQTVSNDDTNIDKYFQDSILLSKFDTQDLHSNTGRSVSGVASNKKPKAVSSNDKGPRTKKAEVVKRSTRSSKPRKTTKVPKSKQDRDQSLDETFFIESSEDESLHRDLPANKETESANTGGKGPRKKIDSNRLPKAAEGTNSAERTDGAKYGESSASDNIVIDKSARNDDNTWQIVEIKSREELAQVRNSDSDSVVNLGSSITSIAHTQDRCKLSAWGLPPDILQKYESRGMKSMFPWQVECLSNYQVLEENKNLVYSAPTSAGKTLVAEMLVMKTVLERQKKVIFILPFVSVVREKMFYFQDLLSSSGIRVEGFMGGIAPAGGLAATHIAIATIEKANSLINRLMEEGGLPSLGAIVVDELHLLGDPHRGYLLELLLTKLKYMTLREEHVNIQLIGMSATLPNLSLLAEWLDAELFNTDFRPVPLNEQYKVCKTIYNSKFTPVRDLDPSPELSSDPDNVLQLCIETIADGHSTLIFCPTKNWCEKLAHQVAAIFFKLGSGETAFGQILRQQLDSNAIEETLSQLQRSPAGLDDVLKSTVSFGVAFHHAGLTMDERDIIEGSFRTGSLRVLIATSTLSSGVNLPARRVIIRSLMFHGRVIDTLTYRQMIGRAGRMGKDTAGESILICKPSEKKAAESLLAAPLDPVESCLEGSGPLIRALLEAVASEVACTPSDVELYSRCTLASFQSRNNVESHTKEAMEYLRLNEFIISQETKDKEQRWVASALGKACLASSVSPGDGLFLFEELQRARKCFVLETELHLIYLVTPFNSGSLTGQIDWMIFFNLWKSLSECERRVGEMVGIEERFIMSATRGIVKLGKQQSIHRRFFTALALHDLVRETPLTTVSEKYGCSRGVLQSLQQSASTFAGMVTQFCKQLGWDCMELLFCQFQARLQFGVCRELLDLLRLPMLNGLRARSLYKEGIKCVADLATVDELSVERALHKALPFESEKEQDGEHILDAAKRNKVRSIFVTGRDGLTPYQAAVMLVQEARTLVQHELGIKDMHWNQENEASKSYSRSSLSVSQDKANKQTIKTSSHTESAGSPPIDTINLNSETSRNINGIPKTNENLVDSKQRSDHCSPITEPRSIRITNVEKKENDDVGMDEIGSEKDPLGDRNQISVLDSIAHTKRISKFDLLGTKRKTRHNDNNIESFHGDDFNQITDRSVTVFPCSGGTENGALNNGPDFCATSNIPKSSGPKTKKNTSHIDTEKPGATGTVGPDLKLSISPVVALELLSYSAKSCNKKSSNDARKYLKPEVVSKQHQMPFELNDEMKVSLSRSPSLFGDSLYLDSQFCNELERNVDGSLGIDKAMDTGSPTINRPSANLEKSIVVLQDETESPTIIIKQITNTSKSRLSLNTNTGQSQESKCPDLNNQILNSEDMNFSWNSTTWDALKESRNSTNLHNKVKGEEVLGTENCNNEFKEGEVGFERSKLRRQTTSNNFDTSDQIAGTPMMQNSRFKSIASKSNVHNVRNVRRMDDSDSRKRKFNEIHSLSDSSPVLSILNLSNNRRLSFDSNKSDSDDIILASQNLDPVKSTSKSRTKLKLDQSKKVAVNKKQNNITLAESRRLSNLVKNKEIELLRTGETSSKKLVYQENYSTDSAVSNSDEDSPVRRLRVTQSLHRRTLNSSFIVQKIENLRKCKKRCLRPNTDEGKSISDEPLDWNVLDIINVTWNEKIFKLFSSELKQKTEISIALAHDKFVNDTVGIGSKLVTGSASATKNKFKKNESCIHLDTIINGVAISWGRNVAYYISFENRKEGSISLKERLQLVRDILTDPSFNVHCYRSKEVYKKLHRCCNITSNCRFLDPNVAEWLLEPETNEKNLHEMAYIYFPQGTTVLQHASSAKISARTSSENERFFLGRHRAAAEAVVTWHVMSKLVKKLHSHSETLLTTFKDVEARVVSTLARMELTGIGINLESLQELSAVLQQEISSLEKQAFSLAGRKFSFTSSKEVAQVLGMYKGTKVSTNKAVLESCDNPISNLVISWRKINATQTKMVFPLLNLAQQGPRVRGCCLTRTATGRVSMHEPNLQNVPRDFNSEDNSFVISMRMAFVPTCGNIMLSADYCQLELRILAHFSKDPVLCEIMKKDSDIFKNIAAQWNHISVEEVTDEIRQHTKQLCYGIIYGMGSKALAKQLSVPELEAIKFMETFMGTYPNVNNWLNQVTTKSREDGYVTTLMERRRLLPGLNSEVKSERSQAERQAVNTKIQGSAADLAKKAMVLVEEKLLEKFPEATRVLSECRTRKLRSSKDSNNRGAYLVLQLHDELLYEVNAVDLDHVAAIVKKSMEAAYKLTVPLPVKIKVGPTWGSLTEYNI